MRWTNRGPKNRKTVAESTVIETARDREIQINTERGRQRQADRHERQRIQTNMKDQRGRQK